MMNLRSRSLLLYSYLRQRQSETGRATRGQIKYKNRHGFVTIILVRYCPKLYTYDVADHTKNAWKQVYRDRDRDAVYEK